MRCLLNLLEATFLFTCTLASGFRTIVDTSNVLVSKGFGSELQCRTSSAFNKCIWTRPNSSVICATFANFEPKECETVLKSGDNAEIQVNPWTVRVEDGNTLCVLKIDKVDEIDQGVWGCTLGEYTISTARSAVAPCRAVPRHHPSKQKNTNSTLHIEHFILQRKEHHQMENT